MAINFSNPGERKIPDPSRIKKDPTEKTPEDRKKEQLLKEKERIEKRLEKLDKNNFLASVIRRIAYKIALFNPNDDPNELYNQISPILGRLGLRGRIEKGEGDIQIFLDKKKGNEYLYQIKIRRAETIDKQTIDKFDREKSVDSFKWDADAILLYLWGPYTLPVTEEKKEKITPEI